MDYKKVLRLHFVNHLSCREIAESCGDCSKTTVNEFLKRFRENPELSYPLPADVTNEWRIRSFHTLYRQMSRMNTSETCFIKSLVYRRISSSTGILTRKLSTKL